MKRTVPLESRSGFSAAYPTLFLTVDKDMRIIHINKAMGDICCISDKSCLAIYKGLLGLV